MTISQPASSSSRGRLPGLAGSEGLDQACALMVRLAVGTRLDRVGAIAHEHLMTGGKRTRARLALAAADAVGVSRPTAAPWAAACELLHQASLVHDDIQDGDRVRRGKVAAWARHGVPAAINTGDLMLMLPWVAVSEIDAPEATRWRLAKVAAMRAEETVRGQGWDLDLLQADRIDIHDWQGAARGKSGALLALPVQGAVLLAGISEQSAAEISEPFALMGALYQACDDLTDLYGEKGREAPGNDLREGKVSLLVVEHLLRHPGDRDALLKVLHTSRESTTADQVGYWIERFDETGTRKACIERIRGLERQILEHAVLRAVPDLLDLATDLVGRVSGGIR